MPAACSPRHRSTFPAPKFHLGMEFSFSIPAPGGKCETQLFGGGEDSQHNCFSILESIMRPAPRGQHHLQALIWCLKSSSILSSFLAVWDLQFLSFVRFHCQSLPTCFMSSRNSLLFWFVVAYHPAFKCCYGFIFIVLFLYLQKRDFRKQGS